MPHVGASVLPLAAIPPSKSRCSTRSFTVLSKERWLRETRDESPETDPNTNRMTAHGTAGACTLSPMRTIFKWICHGCRCIASAPIDHDTEIDKLTGLPTPLVSGPSQYRPWLHCHGCDLYVMPLDHVAGGRRTCRAVGCECRALAPKPQVLTPQA